MKQLIITSTSLLAALLLMVSWSVTPVQAQNASFDSDTDWNLEVTGAIPVFMNFSNHDSFSSDGEDQFATRVMSGFNPANITFNVSAPMQNGLTVTGIFQINHHLQGASVQNDGLFEGRIAEIAVSGNFGTLNVGKGFGIFNSIAIGDNGSGMGVGRFGGPDAANATLGRIGSGYTYANFNPRVTYTTPDLGGFTYKVGLFNPEKPGGATPNIETSMPRIETQADYMIPFENGSAQVFAGGMYQNVDVVSADYDYDIIGWDVGLKTNVAGLNLIGSFSQTEGVGADGLIGLNLAGGTGLDQAEVEATQWYVEGVYDFDGFKLGASYGEGSQDAKTTAVGASPEITNELLMVFARFMVTDNLTFMAEFQDFASDAQADYNAFILGMQLGF